MTILYEFGKFRGARSAIVYDRIRDHIDDKDKLSFKKIKSVFEQLMDWLYKNNLLSPYGLDIYRRIGVDEDFVLDSRMLTARGQRLMEKCYNTWINSIDLNSKSIDFSMLEKCLIDVSCNYRNTFSFRKR